MEPLFTYSADLRTSRCLAKTDINFLFPLGWNFIFSGIGILSAFLGKYTGNEFLCHIVSALIIGNAIEFLFYKMEYWQYNYDAKFMNLFRPFYPRITVSGVPLQIMAGYSIIGFYVWFFVKVILKL